MATKITIPVEFRATSNSMKEILQQFESGMSQVDLSTTLGKKLKKTLEALKEDFSSFEEIAISPTVDRAGLSKAERLFEDFVKKVKSGGTAVEGANVFEFNLSKDELDTLSAYSEKIKDLGRQLDKLKKSGSNRSAESYLTEIGQEKLLTRARNTGKSFKGQSTLGANASAMEKEAAATRDQLERLQANQQSLLTEATTLQQSQRALQTQLKTATKQRDVSQAIIQKGDFLAKFQGLDYKTLHTKSGALRGQTAVLNEFMTAFETGSVGGRISDANRAGAESVLKYLGFDTTQISQLITQQISQIRRAIAEQLEIQDGSNDMLSGEAYQRIQNVQRRSQQYLTQYATSTRYQQYEQEKNAVADLTEQVASAQAKIADNATEQAAIGEEIAKHQQLVTSLTSVIASLQRFQRQLDQSEIDELNEELEKQTQQLANTKSDIVTRKSSDVIEARKKLGSTQDTYTEEAAVNLGNWESKNESEREAEQFTANLKQSIKQWMSAQQVINLVKDGIRQAYQDIQGLDKAMTNIAVVTDMSVSDLWGKINEYMSIAQQYGVSTQGVYEVSQLYYQQGLGTADVMAATTETLKMARIAGMDYADAADAMTVAIRSFKMEMTDAAHVTDVYSKVAAVTASDSQELAIAMSKTASSAESVGSSFENTTAMLAVMIETTRESAQNLGSALKSIISRYGEMKVGSTVDAEGEALDYNKVDTALQSVGISLKDAQGQFRDFDEVIFELSEKWDTLDSVTQRYIATIMAGNRQQSRFIALVDNWERLDEVAGAAQDSEDAGLLQYAKTLDSLETKITNIKTSFQEFYMSIINGPFVGAILEGINSVLQGFNKLGNWQSILNIVGLIRSIKSIAKLIVSTISPSFSSIVSDFKNSMQEMVEVARQKGYEIGKAEAEGRKAGLNGQPAPTGGSGSTSAQQSWLSARMAGDKSGKTSWGSNSWNGSKWGTGVQIGGQLIGSAASIIGSTWAKDNQRAGAVVSHLGNIAQGASMGAAFGPWGAVIGGVIGGLASLPAVLDAFDPASVLAEKLEKAEEALSEANLERATKKEEARNLEATINNLEKLQKARYSSEEAEQAFIDASNAAFEQFPQLTATFDEAGNAIIDVINNSTEAEWLLVKARKEAAAATETAAAAELKTALAEKKVIDAKMDNYEDDSSAGGMGNYYNNWATDMFRIFDIEDGDFAYNADNIWAPVDEGLAAIFAKYESGDNSIAGGLKMLVEDLRSGALDPYLEQAGYTQEDFLNYIKEYINTNNLWDNNGWGGKDIDSILDLYGDYDLLVAEREANSVRIDAAMRAVGKSKINSLLTAEDPTEIAGWREISSAETFLSNAILDKADLTAADFDKDGKLTAAAQTRLDQLFIETYNNYNTFYEKLGYDLDDFNSLIQASSKGTVTKSKVIEQFQQLFGDQSTWDKNGIIQTYYDQIVDNIEENKTRLINDLNNNRFSTKWATYAVDGGEFEQIIDAIPAAYYTHISDFADDIDSRLEARALTQSQADDVISQYFNVLGKLDDKALELTAGQLAEAQRLITEAAADGSLFSIGGIQTLITALSEAGIDVSYLGLDNFPVYTANLVTEWATLQDKLVSNLTTASEAMKKASEGMELDEALKLAQKAGMEWSDFTFIDGKWYTSNIEAIKAYYQEEQTRLLAQLEEEKNRLLGTADSAGALDSRLSANELDTIKGMTLEQFQKEYSIEYGDKPEVWQAIRTYWDPEHYQTWVAKTKKEAGANADVSLATYWTEYFNNLGQTVETATDEALEYWTNESQKQAETATRLASLKSQSQTQADKISAYETIASQGIKRYSAEDLNTIIGSLGWDDSYYTYDPTTGTYDLTEKGLNSIPLLYRNQILASIDAEVQSATQVIESLGDNIFDASDADYSEAFSYLVEAGFQGKDIKKGINYALMQSVVGDPEQLEEYIGRQLAHEMGRTYDEDGAFAAEFSEEITASRENMTAVFKDSYIEQIKQANELIYKKIVGTATFEELEELEDLSADLNIDLSQFTGRLIDDLSVYAQAIINNAYLSAEEKNKYLKDSFNTMLGAKGYAQLYGLDSNLLTQDAATRLGDLSSASQTLSKSKNRMTLDQASEVAAAYANSIGIDPKALLGAFDFNASDNTFSYSAQFGSTAREMQLNTLWSLAERDAEVMAALKEGMGLEKNSALGISQLLAAAADQNTLANIFEAINASGDYQAINVLGSYEQFELFANAAQQANYFAEDARVDKYVSAVEQFAAGQEMSFEELVNLYSELGQEITDPTQLRNLWLQGPKAISEELMSLAEKDALSPEQLKEIQDAQERGVQTLLENIAAAVDRAVEGTATLDDLFTLAESTGIDLTGKVTKTASGYGLNQTGMLAVAVARAQISKDYNGEGAKLVETYMGKGGIFGSAAAIDEAIKKNAEQQAAIKKIIDSRENLLKTEDTQLTKEGRQQKKLYKAEQEALKEEQALRQAEGKVLAAAAASYKKAEADKAANFMNEDPFGGATSIYDTWLSNKATAKTALQEAYNNKGVIADYHQAGQLMSFIGYGMNDGKGWSDAEKVRNMNILLGKYTTENGTDFIGAYREIFGIDESVSDADVMLKAAQLMDESAEKMRVAQEEKARADEAFLDNYEKVEKAKLKVAGKESELITTTEDGKAELKVNELNKIITEAYGTLGVDKDDIEAIAKTRYGDDWQTELADTNKLKQFLVDFDAIVANFSYDATSQLTAQEQFDAYIRGEAAAQKVEERLNELSEQIQSIVTTDAQMQPLLDGINASIQRAEYLRTLLGQLSLGTAYSTGIETITGEDEKSTQIYSGSIYTDPGKVEENILEYQRQLGKVYGLTANQAEKYIKIIEDKVTKEIIGLEYTPSEATGNQGAAFKYMFRDASELGTSRIDPVSQFKIQGEFEEVDKWIEEHKYIEGIYTLSTPKEAKDKIIQEIKELEDSLKVRDVNETDETYNNRIEKTRAQIIELNKLQTELDKRYPNEDDGTIQLKITGTAPESDAELIKWKEDLAKALEGAGNVELTIVDNEGNIISDINSIAKGQQVTISTALAEGTSLETIQTLVDNVNTIVGSLKNANVSVEVTGLTDGTVTTVNNLTTALTALNGLNIKAINVALPGGSEAATAAQSIYDNLTNINGKNYSATMKLTVQTVDNKGNPIVFDENGFVINTEKEEALAGQVETLTTENAALNKQLSEASENNAALTNQNASLQEELTNSENEVATLTEQLSAKETEIANAQSQITALQTENTNLTNQIAELSSKLATEQEKNADLQTQIDNLNAQKIANEEKIAELTKLIDEPTKQSNATETVDTENKKQDFLTGLLQVANFLGQATKDPSAQLAANAGEAAVELLNQTTDKKEDEGAGVSFDSEYTSREDYMAFASSMFGSPSEYGFGSEAEVDELLTGIQKADFLSQEYIQYANKIMQHWNKQFELEKKKETSQPISDPGRNALHAGEQKEEQKAWLAKQNPLLAWYNAVDAYAQVLSDKYTEQINAAEEGEIQAIDEAFAPINDLLDQMGSLWTQLEQETAKDSPDEVLVEDLTGQLASVLSQIAPHIPQPGTLTTPTGAISTASPITANTVDFKESVAQAKEEVEEEPALVTVTANPHPALNTANSAVSDINNKSATVSVYGSWKGILTGGGGPAGDPVLYTQWDPTSNPGFYAGNVNGLAYADGNVDSLIAGAHLANKTLVGELGPELGVWDGMYHLLGQNGAEFVNMPSDAIVFNHRQTEGILKGQWGHRGKALADGNVIGPAKAEVFDKVILPPWGEGTTFTDIVNGFKTSGSKSYKRTDVGELEEWYNLLRKIAKLEAEINLIRAERENITNGREYYKNIREEEALLHEQIATQKLLVDYKKEQLQLERESIEQNKFWSKSLTFNEDGALLSVFGNETKGGKGVFAFLDQLNELSGKEQVALIKKMGYSYTDRDGKALEGEELVKQFVEEYQDVVGNYNELDDSILEAETTIESLTTEINELEDTITENQKELEQSIYDLLVEAAELEIEQMEEANELQKEANEKYIQGLSDALTAEQSLYEKNESIEDRESLQRQLALLRRSGGSASEIESLEKQLDDTLKQEYFDNQQDMIEKLTEANELQTELLERQVQLQEDALEYQKENGVLWTKVYEVMSGSYEDILAFFQDNSQEFFKASALEQKSMLLEWAKIVGIYDEDRAGQLMTAEAERQWENNEVLGNLTAEQQTNFSKLSDSDKTIAQEHYNAAYASARLEGKSDEEARKAARNSMVERLRVDENLGIVRWDPHGNGSGGDSGSGSGSGEHITYYGGYTADGTFIGGSGRYAYGYASAAKQVAKTHGILVDREGYFKTGSSPIYGWKKWYITKDGEKLSQGYSTKSSAEGARISAISGAYNNWNNAKLNLGADNPSVNDLYTKYQKLNTSKIELYSQGGLVDYTGIAMVHGSKSKPESFLNAEQTAQISEALRETTGKESILEGLRSTMDKLRTLVHNISTIDNSNNQNISIAPGAVVIQVEQLADNYDIEELSNDVMNRMVAIASKATNRGVNRR